MKKVALVTGSSRGIGRAVAAELARDGYAVCINYYERKDKADELVALLRAEGREAIAVQADVSKRSEVNAMVAQCERERCFRIGVGHRWSSSTVRERLRANYTCQSAEPRNPGPRYSCSNVQCVALHLFVLVILGAIASKSDRYQYVVFLCV